MNNIPLNNSNQTSCCCFTKFIKKDEGRLNILFSKIMFQLIRLITDTFWWALLWQTDQGCMNIHLILLQKYHHVVVLCLNHDGGKEENMSEFRFWWSLSPGPTASPQWRTLTALVHECWRVGGTDDGGCEYELQRLCSARERMLTWCVFVFFSHLPQKSGFNACSHPEWYYIWWWQILATFRWLLINQI